MTTSPLAKKLLMKAGQRAVIINPPAGYLERMRVPRILAGIPALCYAYSIEQHSLIGTA